VDKPNRLLGHPAFLAEQAMSSAKHRAAGELVYAKVEKLICSIIEKSKLDHSKASYYKYVARHDPTKIFGTLINIKYQRPRTLGILRRLNLCIQIFTSQMRP
jgi:hypothetical protein